MEILLLPMVNLRLKIRMNYWDYYDVVTDENGQFSADIPDGDYVINTVNDAEWKSNSLLLIYFFSVKNGEMVVNQKVVK